MPKKEKSKEKGYTLNDYQRELFFKKIFPILLAGSIIWLVGEYAFSFTFLDVQLIEMYLIIYVSTVIGEVILFLIIYFLAKIDKKFLVLALYIIFTYLAGILSLPIAIYTTFLRQIHMVVTLTVGANIIIILMGLILRNKYFAEGRFWQNLFIFFIGLALVEVIFLFLFDIHNFLLTVPLSLSYICTIALPTMFYSAKIIKNNEDAPWIFLFAKIQGVIILSLVIAIGIVLIVLLIIVLFILAGDSSFNFSGINFSGGGRRKKKKKLI